MGIVTLLAEGATNKEIANELHISVHTVKAHLEAIFEKRNAENRLQAVIQAIKTGLIEIKPINH